ELGFAGVTRDDAGFFYVADPGNSRILKFDADGNNLQSLPTGSYWDLTWSGDHQRIFAVNPGNGRIHAYTSSLVFDPVLSMDWGNDYEYFKENGLAGISWNVYTGDMVHVANSGLMLFTDDNGDIIKD